MKCRITVKRIIVLALLVSATTAGHCAADDWSADDSTQFDAWLATNYPTLSLGPCCVGSPWMTIGGTTQAYSGKRSQVWTDDPVGYDFRDRKGLRRDTYYFLGYQVATIGILYVLPESISSWSDEQKDEYSLSTWWENVTHPTWDEDDFFINYVMHPYWGAAYFVRARERGYTSGAAFWYSAMLSTVYEFGVEALFEEPSIQDLIVTPVFGSLLGGYFMRVRQDIETRSIARGYRSTKDKWLWVLTDPLGAINRQVDRWMGVDTELQIRPYVHLNRRTRNSSSGPAEWQKDRAIGLAFSLEW
jgi:hypothetical protein